MTHRMKNFSKWFHPYITVTAVSHKWKLQFQNHCQVIRTMIVIVNDEALFLVF
jgi:hypothetical protein